MATQDEYIKTALRLPRDLHKEVQGCALSTGRSMNAEIISKLEESLHGSNERARLAYWDLLAGYQRWARYELAGRDAVITRLSQLIEAAIDEAEQSPINAKRHLSQALLTVAALREKVQEDEAASGFPPSVTAQLRDAANFTPADTAKMDTFLAGLPDPADGIESFKSYIEEHADSVLEDRQQRDPDAKSDRTALTKSLETIVESVGKSRTPDIPGVNAPKRGSKRTNTPKK